MSKMSELDTVIKDLRTAAAAINDAADTLLELFSGKTADTPEQRPQPTPSMEEVRAILAKASRKGFTDRVRELLRKHGANKLSEIDPSEYAALVKDAEELDNG